MHYIHHTTANSITLHIITQILSTYDFHPGPFKAQIKIFNLFV